MTSFRQIAPGIRVEAAFVTRVAVATPELIQSLLPHCRPGGPDALGGPIITGRTITYLDMHGPQVWRVYREWFHDGRVRYLPISDHPTEAEAISAAAALEG